LVRLRVGWTAINPPPNPLYFNFCFIDAVSHSRGSGGLGDTVTSLLQRSTTTLGSALNPSPSTPKRIGSLIKMDPGDANFSLPGADNQWSMPSNQFLAIPGYIPSFDNPITILQYTINLDGTEGAREFYGVFRPPGTIAGTNALIRSDGPGVGEIIQLQVAAAQLPATLIVPAPGLAALVVGGIALVARRRR
jgi:hypothetical protein